jgi:hypothetical protein
LVGPVGMAAVAHAAHEVTVKLVVVRAARLSARRRSPAALQTGLTNARIESINRVIKDVGEARPWAPRCAPTPRGTLAPSLALDRMSDSSAGSVSVACGCGLSIAGYT